MPIIADPKLKNQKTKKKKRLSTFVCGFSLFSAGSW